jgi:hypothetical protein
MPIPILTTFVRRGSFVLVVPTAIVLGGCCTEPSEPCIGWAHVGETYTVEVVERVDPALLGYVSSNGEEPGSCGTGVDLAPDATFELDAAGRLDPEHHDECFQDCFRIEARARIAGIDFMPHERPVFHILGSTDLRSEGRADLGSCSVTYQLGVDALTDEQRASGRFATDHVFFRGYSGSVLGDCLGPDAEPEALVDGLACGDVWVVRIRDAQGDEVTRDL